VRSVTILSGQWYAYTHKEWHICSFNAQPKAPAFFGTGPEQAGAFGWALNESISTESRITGSYFRSVRLQFRLAQQLPQSSAWRHRPPVGFLLPRISRPAESSDIPATAA
jgi:hypothetical protein